MVPATGEYHIISGRINDIAWDGDSQRIIAVGDGRERFGHCITADSGNSVGEISGHSSQANTVSIRQQRPMRAATGSDDTSMVFYHGPPFKFNTSLREQHSNYVYGVAFSPDGANLVSVGADRRIWLYNGTTGEAKGQCGTGVHKGSIFGVSWAKDSKSFVTASADQTVQIWDVESQKSVHGWRLGDEKIVSIPDHQVGVVWPIGRSDDLIISLSLSGDLNYLDKRTPRPAKVVQGHQKSITALGPSARSVKTKDTLWTGSYDGRVCGWDVASGRGERIHGESHSNQVAGFCGTDEGEGRIYSIGWDDTLRSIDASTRTFIGAITKVDGQPRAIASLDGKRVVVATTSRVDMYEEGIDKIGGMDTKFTPTAIAASVGNGGAVHVAVGGDDHVVRIYAVSSRGATLELKQELRSSTAAITTLAFSPTQKHLAAGNSSGKILVYNTDDYSEATSRWSAHTARVLCMAWDVEGKNVVSGALDTNVFVWSLAKPGRRIQAANAHKDGVNGVEWVDNGQKVVSVGGDAAVKVWKVSGL